MISVHSIQEMIEKELMTARTARREGNYGRTRVCARRAAGLALKFYFQSKNIQPNSPDVITLLNQFHEREDVPENIRFAAENLSIRVTEDFRYRSPNDPIEDATCLIEFVMKECQS